MFPETPVARACFPNIFQFFHTGSIVSSVNFVSKKQILLLLHDRSISCFCVSCKRGKTRKQLRKHASSFCWPLRSGKTRKYVSRNTCSACMFPQCCPVLPHGKHCFQRQFCFQEAKCAAATRQKHFVFPPGAAWKQGKTRKQLRKHVSGNMFPCFARA